MRPVEVHLQRPPIVQRWATLEPERKRYENPYVPEIFHRKGGYVGPGFIDTLRCRECGELKEAHTRYFNADGRYKAGFEPWCHDCRRLYYRDYMREYQRKRRRKLKEQAA